VFGAAVRDALRAPSEEVKLLGIPERLLQRQRQFLGRQQEAVGQQLSVLPLHPCLTAVQRAEGAGVESYGSRSPPRPGEGVDAGRGGRGVGGGRASGGECARSQPVTPFTLDRLKDTRSAPNRSPAAATLRTSASGSIPRAPAARISLHTCR